MTVWRLGWGLGARMVVWRGGKIPFWRRERIRPQFGGDENKMTVWRVGKMGVVKGVIPHFGEGVIPPMCMYGVADNCVVTRLKIVK